MSTVSNTLSEDTNIINSFMRPAEDAYLLRENLHNAAQISTNDSFFNARTSSFFYGLTAWFISIGDTFSYSGEFFRRASISIINGNCEEFSATVENQGESILKSLKYAILLPSIIFFGLFAPETVYGPLDYPVRRSDSSENPENNAADSVLQQRVLEQERRIQELENQTQRLNGPSEENNQRYEQAIQENERLLNQLNEAWQNMAQFNEVQENAQRLTEENERLQQQIRRFQNDYVPLRQLQDTEFWHAQEIDQMREKMQQMQQEIERLKPFENQVNQEKERLQKLKANQKNWEERWKVLVPIVRQHEPNAIQDMINRFPID
ncbi:MAG: hypothetical protein Tsb0015_13320 [Simkaniaceae bacterium]